ncbi:MAG: twin-arginine translocation signal domain-containing protein [Clostridiales bacterium]|nr:twin-arginine translocation signal domain-containing protein [Clostridiales bacterium]
MSELTEKVLDQSTNYGLKYVSISRRTFLKGALAVGGALALAGTTAKIKASAAGELPPPVAETLPSPPGVSSVVPVAMVTPSRIPIDKPSFILPKYEKCIGCKKCQIACAIAHTEEVRDAANRVIVEKASPDMDRANMQIHSATIVGGRVDLPILCMKCGTFLPGVMGYEPTASYAGLLPLNATDTAFCFQNCPENAIARNSKTGAMQIDRVACTVCGSCVTACKELSVGCLRMSRDKKANGESMWIVGMCDLCNGNPQCVAMCPEGVLEVWLKDPFSGNRNESYNNFNDSPLVLARRIAAAMYKVE